MPREGFNMWGKSSMSKQKALEGEIGRGVVGGKMRGDNKGHVKWDSVERRAGWQPTGIIAKQGSDRI